MVCGSTITCFQKSSFERHFTKQHCDLYGHLAGADRDAALAQLKAKYDQKEEAISSIEVFLMAFLHKSILQVFNRTQNLIQNTMGLRGAR